MTIQKIPPKILALAKQLKALRDQSLELGLFTGDRELLTCPNCRLQEDVVIGGQLITYDSDQPDAVDSGLRFSESDDGSFVCPRCGTAIAG